MMVDLEQLKADREAGTAGTWKWERNRYGYCVELAPSVIELPLEEQLDLSDADARRIARLPDLEAAYIEAVAKLDNAVEALRMAANQFRYYEENHHLKRTSDGVAKAETNRRCAEQCEIALAQKEPVE